MMTRRSLWLGLVCLAFDSNHFGGLDGPRSLLAPDCSPTPSPRQRLIYLTNQERAKAGLPPLRENELLAQAALTHARAMAEGDFFAHENLMTGTGPPIACSQPVIGG